MSIWDTPTGPGEPLGLSVGELLMEADASSRQLLVDARAEDAPTMLRGWAEVVEAAARLWTAMPFSATTYGDDRLTMERLVTASRNIHQITVTKHWPGPGPTDTRLDGLRDLFDRATDLIEARRADLGPPGRPKAGRTVPAGDADAFHADINAARVRIMHILYVGVHAVGRTANEHANMLLREQSRSRRPWQASDSGVIVRDRDLARRLSTLERIAGSYVGQGRYVRRLAAEQSTPADVTDRLAKAIARWDLVAHRTLAAEPTPHNFALTCHTQAMIAAELVYVVDTGRRTGTLTPPQFLERMSPALNASHNEWAGAARRWSTLAEVTGHPDLELVDAAQELRAATRAISRDGQGWAAPTAMAARADPGHIAQHLQQGLSAGLNLAHMMHDSQSRPELTGSARALQEWLHDVAPPPPATDPDRARVSPRDIMYGRRASLPLPLQQDLTLSLEQTLAAADAALSASTWLDLPSPGAARDLGAAGLPTRTARGVQQRLPMLEPGPSPAAMAPPPA